MARTDKRLLARVSLARPTIALAVAALGAWIGGGALVFAGHWLAGMALASVAAYVAFTPMHDAAHRAVGDAKWLNALIGRLMSLPLQAPFVAFRQLHLEHHKHTNDPAKDPDHYSGRGPRWQLPLRWLTQDLHYYGRYLRSDRPRAEQVETWGMVAAFAVFQLGLVVAGYWEYALFGVLLPARLALTALAFAFDYLPHRPHVITGREDRFKATSVRPTPWLTPVLLSQNFHLIHHLYPAVPFYRYPAVWRAREAELRAKGATVIESGRPAIAGGHAGPRAT